MLSVVTPDGKYIYWFYGDAALEPAEELYDMGKDRLEMVNEAGNPEKRAVLEQMRTLYDAALSRARKTCIQANRYPEFLASAGRTVPWSKKQWTAQPHGPVPAANNVPAGKNRKR